MTRVNDTQAPPPPRPGRDTQPARVRVATSNSAVLRAPRARTTTACSALSVRTASDMAYSWRELRHDAQPSAIAEAATEYGAACEQSPDAPILGAMPPRTPLAVRPILVLVICTLSEPVSCGILFPFVYFMVKDFNFVPEHQLGYYVGLLASAFSFAQFLTSALWGLVSDKFGRKPILLTGLLGNTATMLAFGVSKSFPMALAARLICGVINANVGVAKCVLGELCDDTNQDKGFALFGMAWGLGGILGPMIGGLLASPATVYPSIFGGIAFLEEYPYFLPCAVSSCISLIGWFAGLFLLDETHPKLRKGKQAVTNEAASANPDAVADEAAPLLGHAAGRDSGSTVALSDAASDRVKSSGRPASPTKSAKQPSGLTIASYHAVAGYAQIALHSTLYDEVFALFAVQPPARGGLQLTSVQLGSALAAMGLAELLVTLCFYPPIARRTKPLTIYRWVTAMYPVAYLAFPLVSEVARAGDSTFGTLQWAILLAAMFVRLALCCFVFTPVMCMVNNSAPPEYLGRVNGLGQTCAAAVRGIGPAVGTIIYAWSTTTGTQYGFPLNYWLVWLLLAVLAGAQWVHATRMPESLNNKVRSEAEEEDVVHAPPGMAITSPGRDEEEIVIR